MNAIREREIFDAALEIADGRERDAALDRACAGDAQLRARVGELLADHLGAEKFFAECAGAFASSAGDFSATAGNGGAADEPADTADDAIGSRIGPYKLLQKIGEGGCGAVYMAEQERPVRRRVALKIIKLGMDTKSVIARFEAERQALAMMEHPNIARVLDAGATETGRPYFVMELVHGIRITEYCDANELATRGRLGLFMQVCQAIQHAHQKGIIHRDIKPSNILVTMLDGVPVPKVIDFGIAKAIEEKLTDKTLFTMYGNFIGTPAYMSPEQAQMSGMDVDTRSDIYSLGVLLYELLTGRTPFDQKELMASGLDGLRRTLRDEEPRRPSAKVDTLPPDELTVTAQHRHVEPLKLRSELQGDLDWIVMRALEKDRSRRYQTANGLGTDVRRYLDNEPVSACPPGRFYRFQKLVRRNKAVFAGGTAVAVALMAGFGTSTWLFFRERTLRKEQVRLREVADRALASEAVLRHEAEARAKITQAAILLSRNRFEEADTLVDKLDLPVTEPSLEASGVFRRLADWNVTRGHWKPAAGHLLKLVEASQIDKTDMTDEATRELLQVGPVLVLIGNTNSYLRFFQSIITRFSETKNPVAAEHVVKASTLLPLDQKTARSLEPLAKILEESMSAPPPHSSQVHMAAWRALALTQFEYRRGNYGAALGWGRKCLAFQSSRPTCVASCHAILAMVCHKLGLTTEAGAELAVAQTLIWPKFPGGLRNGLPRGDDRSGLWYDWIEALLLLNEAVAEIDGGAPSPLLP
jgi:serine/threonine protein kinase